MKTQNKLATGIALAFVSTAFAFDGRITVTVMRGGQTETLLYTVGTNCLRVERGESDRPYAKNLVARDTGDITLLFPNNRSFVRLHPAAAGNIGQTNLTAPPQLPPDVGPQASAPGGGGAIAAMPGMPPMPMEPMELKATEDTTNLLGCTCTRYQLQQRGEVMEIWATDKLLPFQPYLENQPLRIGPRMIEEQWGELLKAKKLFPLRAVLKFENGPERLRFEVKSVTPGKIEDKDGALFQPPRDYHEIQALPF